MMPTDLATTPKRVSRGQVLLAAFVAIWMVTLVTVLTLSYALEGTNPWAGGRYFTYSPGPWCELERTDDFMREPANAGSVFGFLAVGLFMVYCGVHNWLWPCTVSSEAESALGKVNPIVAHPSLSLLCGVANIVHAVGSFWYHSCRCLEGRRLDEVAMFTVAAFPFFYNTLRVALHMDKTRSNSLSAPQHHNNNASSDEGPPPLMVTTPQTAYLLNSDQREKKGRNAHKVLLCGLLYICFAVNCWFVFDAPFYSPPFRDLIMALIITLDALTFIFYSWNYTKARHHYHRDKRLCLWALAILGIGFFFHTVDRFNIICFPESMVQGHAIWHICCALALHVAHLMFRHEYYYQVTDTFAQSPPLFDS